MKSKKFFVATILFMFTLLSVMPSNTYAVSSGKMPIGGIIVLGEESRQSMAVAVTCLSLYGPFFVAPNNAAPAGVYAVNPYGRGSYAKPIAGKKILGQYNVKPDMNTCFVSTTGTAVPALIMDQYDVK